MERKVVAEKLISLCKLDIDAILAYNHAIDGVEEPDIRVNLEAFRDDHNRHVINLSTLILEYGGVPPTFERDFKGFFIEGMTATAAGIGTRAALLAMMGNETVTNSYYKSADALDFPPEVQLSIARYYDDEQRHLTYIKKVLKEKFGLASTKARDNKISPDIAV